LINQKAFLSGFDCKEAGSTGYKLNDQVNGVYFMLTEGEVQIGEQILKTRDAVGV